MKLLLPTDLLSPPTPPHDEASDWGMMGGCGGGGVAKDRGDPPPNTVNVGNSRHIFVASPDNRHLKKIPTLRHALNYCFRLNEAVTR